MNKLLLLSGAAALLAAAPALAAEPPAYNAAASAQAAQTWPEQDAAIQAEDSGAVLPNGSRLEVIANPPIPDTAANRARYGEPDSMSGRLTSPIGD